MYRELFKGTAPHYARYRRDYPKALFTALRREFGLDGTGRLLDVGCGTGRLAVPLHTLFEEIVAVDPSKEMIEEAKAAAAKAKASNIKWIAARAEDLASSVGRFRLIVFGNSLHWMDSEKMIRKCRRLLADGGVAVISERSLWRGTEAWQHKVIEVVKKFLGEERRAGKGKYITPKVRFEDMLARHFSRTKELTVEQKINYSVESIIGSLYSTSYCSKEILGSRVTEFEKNLMESLLSLHPSGKFRETKPLQILLGWP